MDAFLVRNASGTGALEFFERTPADTRLPIERFKVRLTDLELSAIARVYAGYSDSHLAPLFSQMAENWKGWQGEIAWESLEGELQIGCSQDRAGHVFVRIVLRSGPTEEDWELRSTIMSEAGQLEQLARQASAFFGRSD